MPPVEAGQYLLDYFWEAGPTMQGGMSAAPLTHAEIRSWCELVGVELEPWEARCLRRLSIAYQNEAQNATKRDAPAPWTEGGGQVEKVLAGNATKNALRALAAL